MSEQESGYKWGHSRRYNDYSTYIKNTFGKRVQKISVNVGFSCPNRDGTKGIGGCIYCDNNTFKPGYCEPEISVADQVKKGVEYFEKKYPNMLYVAYFQAYTNTYAPIEQLKQLYIEALNHEKVIGLIVGTRPDCFTEEIAKMLCEVANGKYLAVEFGIESTLDKTLLEINRCHTWSDTLNSVQICDSYNIKVGGHLILGLPGENHADFLHHAKELSKLPLHTLKIHQLQVITHTQLAQRYNSEPESIPLFSLNDYLSLVIEFIEQLNPDIIIERFVSVSPVEKLIAPRWNKVKNFEVVAQIEKRLKELNTWQGKKHL